MPPAMLPPHPVAAVLRKAECSHALQHVDRHHLTFTQPNAPCIFCCGRRLRGWEKFASRRLPSTSPPFPQRDGDLWKPWLWLLVSPMSGGRSRALAGAAAAFPACLHLFPLAGVGGRAEELWCAGIAGKSPTACNEQGIDSAAGRGWKQRLPVQGRAFPHRRARLPAQMQAPLLPRSDRSGLSKTAEVWDSGSVVFGGVSTAVRLSATFLLCI